MYPIVMVCGLASFGVGMAVAGLYGVDNKGGLDDFDKLFGGLGGIGSLVAAVVACFALNAWRKSIVLSERHRALNNLRDAADALAGSIRKYFLSLVELHCFLISNGCIRGSVYVTSDLSASALETVRNLTSRREVSYANYANAIDVYSGRWKRCCVYLDGFERAGWYKKIDPQLVSDKYIKIISRLGDCSSMYGGEDGVVLYGESAREIIKNDVNSLIFEVESVIDEMLRN